MNIINFDYCDKDNGRENVGAGDVKARIRIKAFVFLSITLSVRIAYHRQCPGKMCSFL